MHTRTDLDKAQYLVGRVFDIKADLLVKAWDAKHLTIGGFYQRRRTLYVHLSNGTKDTRVDIDSFWEALLNGYFVESDTVAPFLCTTYPFDFGRPMQRGKKTRLVTTLRAVKNRLERTIRNSQQQHS